jgi:hypothetical protein
VIERKRGLIDWGEVELGRNTDKEFTDRLNQQIRRCSPAAIAIENLSHTLRGTKARRRVQVALVLSLRLGLAARALSTLEVRAAINLNAGTSKHELAERLCDICPELVWQMPRRAIWMKDPRMNVFQAVALAVAATRLGPK